MKKRGDYGSRRDFLKGAGFILASGLTTFGGVLGNDQTGEKLPNLIVILADDLGIGDAAGLERGGRISTPAWDTLRRQGVSFTDAHSPSSVCTPTRYGLLTGRYAWRTRLQQNVLTEYCQPLIDPGRTTLPLLLGRKGYHSACIGKWHLGWRWQRRDEQVDLDHRIEGGPNACGFDEQFGVDVPNYPPFCFIEDGWPGIKPTVWWPGDLDTRPGPMVTGWRFEEILPALAARACRYIGQRAAEPARPFFLYLPITSPHSPIRPADNWSGRSRMNRYADFVMATDAAIGEVLAALDRNRLSQNTLLIVTSDNGAAPRGATDELVAAGHASNGIYRGAKGDLWEGGHRVPFVARWPARMGGGVECNQLICLTDLLATSADITGQSLPPDAGEDSLSILPALLSGRKVRDTVVHHSVTGAFAVRSGSQKLLMGSGSGGWWSEPTDEQAASQSLPARQLYDLVADPSEQNNLYPGDPTSARGLEQTLEQIVLSGRSTAGPGQKNDVDIDWRKLQPPPK